MFSVAVSFQTVPSAILETGSDGFMTLSEYKMSKSLVFPTLAGFVQAVLEVFPSASFLNVETVCQSVSVPAGMPSLQPVGTGLSHVPPVGCWPLMSLSVRLKA